ncbi:proton-conducting transporter transmembrane domain-containing protein, partial [Streptomyces flavidovirens]
MVRTQYRVFFAFAVKAPLWPLHTWLPNAMGEATAPVAVL